MQFLDPTPCLSLFILKYSQCRFANRKAFSEFGGGTNEQPRKRVNERAFLYCIVSAKWLCWQECVLGPGAE